MLSSIITYFLKYQNNIMVSYNIHSGSLDVKSLENTLISLGGVDQEYVIMTQFWDNFSIAVSGIMKEAKADQLFAGLKQDWHREELKQSLSKTEWVRNRLSANFFTKMTNLILISRIQST